MFPTNSEVICKAEPDPKLPDVLGPSALALLLAWPCLLGCMVGASPYKLGPAITPIATSFLRTSCVFYSLIPKSRY